MDVPHDDLMAVSVALNGLELLRVWVAFKEGGELGPLLLEVFEVSTETTVVVDALIDTIKVGVASQVEHRRELLKLLSGEVTACLVGGLDGEDLVEVVAHVREGIALEEWTWDDLLGAVHVAVGVLGHGLKLLHLSLNRGRVLRETTIGALDPEGGTSFFAESRWDVVKYLWIDGRGIICAVFEDLKAIERLPKAHGLTRLWLGPDMVWTERPMIKLHGRLEVFDADVLATDVEHLLGPVILNRVDSRL